MVLKEVKAKLSALQPVSEELNSVSDALRDEIREIETELAGLSIGVPVTLEDPFDMSEQREEFNETTKQVDVITIDHRLAYDRHEGKWRLLVKKYKSVRGEPDGYGGYSWDNIEDERFRKPLLETPRRLRVSAAAQISDLLDAIKLEAEKKIRSVKKVTDK